MGLGDFLSDILTTGVQNLPAIVSAVRGPSSPQAQSFFPGAPLGTGAPATSVDAFLRNLVGAGAPGGAPAALPQGYAPALFNPARTVAGRPSPKRITWSFAGGVPRAWSFRGRPVLFSGDLKLARSFARTAGYSLVRTGTARVGRRRRPR